MARTVRKLRDIAHNRRFLADFNEARAALDQLVPDGSAAAQLLSGAGAINLTTKTTLYTSTGAAQALTLADATDSGQRKRIVHVVDGGSGVLTAGGALHLAHGIASITLANARDWIELEWNTGLAAWVVVGFGGAGVAFA